METTVSVERLFEQKSDIVTHTKTHDSENRYACTQCPHKTNSRKFLPDHIRRVHKKYKYEVKYNVCGKKFLFKHLLDRHSRVHTGEKPYKRDVCTKAYQSKDSVIIHKFKHTNEKPFKCVFCEYACKDNSNLKQHQNEVHLGIFKYPCLECTKSFANRGNLLRHLRCKHGKEENYMCDMCGFETNNKLVLVAHLRRIHTTWDTQLMKHCGYKHKITFKHNDDQPIVKQEPIDTPELVIDLLDIDKEEPFAGFEVDPEMEHDVWNMLKTISEVLNSSDAVTEPIFEEGTDTPDLEIDLLDIVKEEPFAESIADIGLLDFTDNEKHLDESEVDPGKEHYVLNSSDEVTETNFEEGTDTPDLEIDLLDIVKEERFAESGGEFGLLDDIDKEEPFAGFEVEPEMEHDVRNMLKTISEVLIVTETDANETLNTEDQIFDHNEDLQLEDFSQEPEPSSEDDVQLSKLKQREERKKVKKRRKSDEEEMAISCAERGREDRKRLRDDPEQYEEAKRKDRERKREYYKHLRDNPEKYEEVKRKSREIMQRLRDNPKKYEEVKIKNREFVREYKKRLRNNLEKYEEVKRKGREFMREYNKRLRNNLDKYEEVKRKDRERKRESIKRLRDNPEKDEEVKRKRREYSKKYYKRLRDNPEQHEELKRQKRERMRGYRKRLRDNPEK